MAGQKFDAPNIGDTPLLHYLIHHTAMAGRPGAGPALALSLVLVAIVCVFTGLCYAELASMIPIAGSAYTYTYATLGELVAWIIGWDLILEYAFSNMSVSVGFSAHIVDLLDWFGLHPPAAMDLARLSAHRPAGSGGQRPLQARLALRLQHSRLSRGHDPDGDSGARHPRVGPHQQHAGSGQDRRHPGVHLCRAPASSSRTTGIPFMPNGWTGVLTGGSIIFFTYIGFDSVSTAAEECKNPQRDMPIGILATLVACTVLYGAVASCSAASCRGNR